MLSPGVNEDVRTTGQGIGLKVAGARDKDGALLVDGLWNTDESFTYPKVKYSQDAIAEFQVQTMGGAAEYGRFGRRYRERCHQVRRQCAERIGLRLFPEQIA